MSDRTAVVTGGSGGIGLACARVLADRGYDLLLIARREQPLQSATAELGCRYFAADVSDEAAVAAAYDTLDRVDFVVHAAGMYDGTIVRRQPVDVFDRVLQANLRSAYLVASQALPKMAAGGRIVFISSTASAGMPTLSAYSASKGGLTAFARALAGEVERLGIGVHLVTPGPVDTPMFGAYAEQVPTLKAAQVAQAVGWLDDLDPSVRLTEIVLERVTEGPFA